MNKFGMFTVGVYTYGTFEDCKSMYGMHFGEQNYSMRFLFDYSQRVERNYGLASIFFLRQFWLPQKKLVGGQFWYFKKLIDQTFFEKLNTILYFLLYYLFWFNWARRCV